MTNTATRPIGDLIEICPSQEDDHAPFPHYLIVSKNETYVICAHCSHWIERFVKGCHCRENCHVIAALDRDLFVTKPSTARRGRKRKM